MSMNSQNTLHETSHDATPEQMTQLNVDNVDNVDNANNMQTQTSEHALSSIHKLVEESDLTTLPFPLPNPVKIIKSESKMNSVNTNKPQIIQHVFINTDSKLISSYSKTTDSTSESGIIADQRLGITSVGSDADNFAELSYMDVQINLRLLADVKEGEKLMVLDETYITVDQRYGQLVRRYWSCDSRERTLRFINHLINAAKRYCKEAVDKVKKRENKQDNLEKLINIQSLLKSSMTGLSRMATTYAQDKKNSATIETYKSNITVFCDQDLKRAIDDGKS